MSITLIAALGAGLLAVGCTGTVSGGNGSNGGGKEPGDEPGPGTGKGGSGGTSGGMMTGPGGGGGPTPVMPGAINVGISPLRRLTAEQYRNTVRDLLMMPDAKTTVLTTDLPADGAIADRFSGNATGVLAGLDADTYSGLAEKLATKAAANLTPLLPCQPSAGKACATQFIQAFGKRAFRRPLSDAEVTRFEAVFTTGSTGGTFQEGIKLVIQAMLQSPKFLYLIEPIPANGAGKVFQVDGWAMATRLSYFFLNSMPDAGLFTAAEANQLGTPDQVADQAHRLIKDMRFRETLATFHNEWLELDALESADKDAMMFPTWTDALKTALGQQTEKFIEGVIADGDGKMASLLASSDAWLSGPLYDLYGVTKPANTTAWSKVTLKSDQRAGLLTHAGLLAGLAHENRTSFILRGKLVREAILCFEVPPPPANVDTSEMMVSPTATAKERSEMHRSNPSCMGCHAAFDPIGFAFEGYDAIGKYRTTDAAGKPIDTEGELVDVSKALDGKVPNAVALAQKLSTSTEAGECMARMWMRFGLGRSESDKEDTTSLAAAFKAMKDSGGSIPEMLVSIARSDSFRHQKVNP